MPCAGAEMRGVSLQEVCSRVLLKLPHLALTLQSKPSALPPNMQHSDEEVKRRERKGADSLCWSDPSANNQAAGVSIIRCHQ